MRPLLFLLMGFISLNVFSQTSNVIFFNDEGIPFKVMIDGEIKNDQPQSQVKLMGMSQGAYKVKIIFADAAYGELIDKINVRPGFEQKYIVQKKKVSDAEKKFKSLGNSIARDVNAKDETAAAARKEEIQNMDSKFVIKLSSYTELFAAPANVQPTAQPQQPVHTTTVVTGTPPPATVQQTTTTTTTVGGQPAGGANVSMNINLGGLGFGANVTETNSYSSSTTTTTTTSGGAVVPAQQTTVIYVPGYGGPVGCPMPMDPGSFANAKQSIDSKSFEDSKMTIAKQIIGSNCLTSAQVKEIMLLFSFENTRLDFAKFAYGRTYDIGNYYVLNDAFDFESSIDDLNSYINGYRR